jgi:hypothetical protein
VTVVLLPGSPPNTKLLWLNGTTAHRTIVVESHTVWIGTQWLSLQPGAFIGLMLTPMTTIGTARPLYIYKQ